MGATPLLNPRPSEARVCQEILQALRDQVEEHEDRLRKRRAASFEEYVEWSASAAASRRALQAAEDVFARNFKV